MSDTCQHCQNDISKASESENKQKVAKSVVPYDVVKDYEKEFKSDFGKTIGEMGNDLMKKLESYIK